MGRGKTEHFRMVEMVYIFGTVVVTRMYTFVKAQTVHLKLVHWFYVNFI